MSPIIFYCIWRFIQSYMFCSSRTWFFMIISELEGRTQGIAILLGADSAHYILSDLLCCSHALHYLEVCDLLFQHVFICAQLKGLNYLRELADLGSDFGAILPTLVLLQQSNLTIFAPHLENIQSILFLYFHHCSSKLNPFVEVLKDLLFDRFHLIFFINTPAIGANSIATNRHLPMSALDSR